MNPVLLCGVLAAALLISVSSGQALAQPHDETIPDDHTDGPASHISPINGMIGLKETTISFHAPADNTLPWGYVEGNVASPVAGYPAILQIFKDGHLVHFAQTDIAPDGTYEYKFRVFNSDEGVVTKIFSGDYTIKIFTVVYLNYENMV